MSSAASAATSAAAASSVAATAGQASAPAQPSAAAAASTTAAARGAPPSSKKQLPRLPFSFELRYGDGPLPTDARAPTATTLPLGSQAARSRADSGAASASDAAGAAAATTADASPYSLYDCSASTPDLPCIPLSAAPLQLHLRLLLYPSAKRGDVGSFVSSLRALQVAAHYLFGWQVWQLRGEEGQRTVRGGGAAVAYPELHVRLWSNPSLPSNMQLVAAQRALLQRLPTIVAQAFGQRDVADIIRAAVQSAYIRHGVPTHHEPQAQQQQQQHPQSPPQAASAEQNDGAGPGACEEQRFAASFGAQFPEPFAQLLSVLQSFLAKRSADDEEADDAFLRKQERTLPRSGDGGGTGPNAAAAPPSLAASTLVNTIAALAPASAYGRASSNSGSFGSSAAASSSGTGTSPDAVPLRFALRHPLLPQFARPLQSSLSLLKKSVAWVGGVELQLRTQGGSCGSNQRNVRLQLRGAEFAAIYAFLQHALPMDASSNEEDAFAAAAACAHRRLAGLSLFAEWLGLLRAAVVPSRRAAAAAAAATDPGQVHAQQLVRRVVLANLHAHEQPGASKNKQPA